MHLIRLDEGDIFVVNLEYLILAEAVADPPGGSRVILETGERRTLGPRDTAALRAAVPPGPAGEEGVPPGVEEVTHLVRHHDGPDPADRTAQGARRGQG